MNPSARAPVRCWESKVGKRLAQAAKFLVCGAILISCGCFNRGPQADVTIINGAEPESLDPAVVTGVPEMRITKALFDGLTRLDARTARPVPALAERWEVSPDGRIYTFFLRMNAAWSTGEPITTADVIWSWLRALSPVTGSDYAGQLFCIKGAEQFYNGKIPADQIGFRALDSHRLRVELNTPVPFFLDICAFPTLAVVPRETIEKYGDRWLHARPLPVSGAFELGEWRLNDRVRLVRNPRYWDAEHTASKIIDVLPVGSPSTALNLYETGMADIVWDKDLVPAELLDVLKKRPDFHTFDFLGTYFFRFNVTRAPFRDVRVRRAFALATDQTRLVKKLLPNGETPAFHFVPDATKNYLAPDGLKFDPEQARRLLAEAGFPEGRGFPRVRYAFPAAAGGASAMQGRIGVELVQMWRDELGVDVELQQIERKIFYNAQSRLDFDLSGSSWVADYNDPNTFLGLFTSDSGNNRTGWKNPRYDELIHGANLETDLRKRAGIFREAEELLVNHEAPIVPLYFFEGFNYFDPRKVSGIYQNALDEHPLQNIYRRSKVEGREASPQSR